MSLQVRNMRDLLRQSIKVEEGGSRRSRGANAKVVKDEAEADIMDIAENAEEDDYVQDQTAMEEMREYGLPTQFNLGGVTTVKKLSGGVTIKEEKNRKGNVVEFAKKKYSNLFSNNLLFL